MAINIYSLRYHGKLPESCGLKYRYPDGSFGRVAVIPVGIPAPNITISYGVEVAF